MLNRRGFCEVLAGLPIVGSAFTRRVQAKERDFFAELGVKPFLNAAGTYTALTASLMPPRVLEAMQYASARYVSLDALHDAVGARIAQLVECEAAMVTAGAASALTLGTAACVTGSDPERIRRLPEIDDGKNEVIIQKSHRNGFDHALRNCGIRLIEVETAAQLESSISHRTAMLFFMHFRNPEGRIKREQFPELGKKHSIPTFIDAAADVPPSAHLKALTRMGYDLVAFSGGKGLRGPQSSGLLLGRKDLIQAARLNGPPSSDTIGRGMKVNKEEMLGLLVAVEQYLGRDEEKERRRFQDRVDRIRAAASSVPGIETEVEVPEIANHVPHLHIWWKAGAGPGSVREVVERLREGDPSVEVKRSRRGLVVNPWMLQEGETAIVAKQIRRVLDSS